MNFLDVTGLLEDGNNPREAMALPPEIDHAKLFIPISLGNHYYNNEVLGFIVNKLIPRSGNAVIFLCDRLREISYEMRGIDPSLSGKNIALQLRQMRRTLEGLGFNHNKNAAIADWSYLKESGAFVALVHHLFELVERDDDVSRHLSSFVKEYINQFDESRNGSLTKLQRAYVVEETALCLFMTEMQGFNTEVYRRGMGFVDYLYEHKSPILRQITRKATLERKFISLESIFATF